LFGGRRLRPTLLLHFLEDSSRTCDVATPMGISEFKLLEKLPQQLKGTLSTIEEIEAELANPDGASDE
jgi:hypothetical protein